MTTGGFPIPIPCIAQNLLQVGPSGNRTGTERRRTALDDVGFPLDFPAIFPPFYIYFTEKLVSQEMSRGAMNFP